MIEITDINRDEYGGDVAITSTVPKIHPRLGIPLPCTRDQIRGAEEHYRTFYRGDIIFKDDPTLEFNFTWYPDTGTEMSRRYWMLLKVQKGFEEAEAKDWLIRPVLQKLFEIVDGRICIPIGRNAVGKDEYEVLMVRPAERYYQEMARMQQIDQVVGQGEKKIAAAAQAAGITAMPTQVEVTPHRYNLDDVVIR